ncbi:MAG: alpha-glucan family phosphorylase [Candidatus Margulisiibacteriota bacterium]
MDKNILDLIGIDTSKTEYLKDISDSKFLGFPIKPIIKAEEALRAKEISSVAYFSMEYGLGPSIYHTYETENEIDESNVSRNHEVFSNLKQMDYFHQISIEKLLDLPIYSGGLGVLAGDTLKSAADLKVSLVAIGILWHKGYFQQKFWFRGGGQFPEALSWDPDSYPGLIPMDKTVEIDLSGHKLKLRLWKYYVYSYDLKSVVPLVLLDAVHEDNPEYLHELTDQLYRSTNAWIKLSQRMILGVGGIKALEALGYNVGKYHLNEGHAAFAFVEKVRTSQDVDSLKKIFSYTCHTPVEAGHDRFDFMEIEGAAGQDRTEIVRRFGTDPHNHNVANLTQLCMNACDAVNAVSKKHGEVTRIQFPAHRDKIKSITNGIHTFTWMSDPIKKALLKHKNVIGSFESDPTLLANAAKLKGDLNFRKDLWEAHIENKKQIAGMFKQWFFSPDAFTLSWARRFATYKRPTMLFQDVNKLVEFSKNIGELQIIIAGKAHPADVSAAHYMDEIMEKINHLGGQRKTLRILFLENYDTYFAKLLTSSVDVWLNNPLPPFEASGTSGMKAIANGVVQLSTVDGWIVEAADKGIGETFGYVPREGELGSEADLKMDQDSSALYGALSGLMTSYYDTVSGIEDIGSSKWIDMMVNCIVESAYFSTQRMVSEYRDLIWDK